jgi:DNA recombination protein RmuC
MIVGIIVAGVVVGVAIVVGALYFFLQKFTLQLTRSNEAQRKSNKEEIESGVKDILDTNSKLLKETIKGLEVQLDSTRKDSGSLREQNAAIREQLALSAKSTQELQVSTESLKNLLANNRLRGEWGEQVAEDLLLAAGFVEKLNYIKQKTTVQGRPDFTILLPDGYKLNVDAKFPFDDLIKYQEAKEPAEKSRALRAFNASVKQKIKDITSKDYIDPEKGLMEILGLISKFQDEYEKFGDSVEKLGRQIDMVKNTYVEVEGTRNRQLTRVVRQISEHSQNNLDKDPVETKLL